MIFHFDQSSIPSTYYNLALEESLALNLIEMDFLGGIRFWKNSDSIILGLSDKLESNVPQHLTQEFKENFDSFKLNGKNNIQNKIAISRRASGGGTVFHNQEMNLNFSLFISLKYKPELYPVKESYHILLNLISLSLKNQNITSFSEGKSDICILDNSNVKKISGNAQFRKKNCIVHHGTLILNPSLIERVSDLLPHPPQEPDYRKNRKHSDFITALPNDFDLKKFKEDLSKYFCEYLNSNLIKIPLCKFKKISVNAKTLMKDKYLDEKFICG